MDEQLITFATPYEVLLREDSDARYIGINLKGDYLFGFLSEELEDTNEVHIYIIANSASLIAYFNKKISLFDLALNAQYLFYVKKDAFGHVLFFEPISSTSWHSEYEYLKKSYYRISQPKMLREIEERLELEQDNFTKNISAFIVNIDYLSKIVNLPKEIKTVELLSFSLSKDDSLKQFEFLSVSTASAA